MPIAAALRRVSLFGVLSAVASSTTAQAPCPPAWLPGTGFSGPNGTVYASVLWDPDGSGPLPEHVVVGGSFSHVGSLPCGGVAMWEPLSNTWSALGGGTDGVVRSLTVLANGELLVGGAFATVSTVAATNIARWNGTSWAPLGIGVDGGPIRMLELANGDVVAIGFMTGGVARWNGASWVSMPLTAVTTPKSQVYVTAVAQISTGDVVCGLSAPSMGGSGVFLTRWTGTAWVPFGAPDDEVTALRRLPNGDLLAFGRFTTIGGIAAGGVARWNGTAWSTFPQPPLLAVGDVVVQPNGDLLATSRQGPNLLARFDGLTWTTLASTQSYWGQAYTVVQTAQNELVLGGDLGWMAGINVSRLARSSGGAWTAVMGGNDGTPDLIVPTPSGGVLVAGDFTYFGGIVARRVVHFDGSQWRALGGGVQGPVRAMLELPNGDVLVGGSFSSAGGVPVSNLARWNGTTWSAFGALNGPVHALARLPNGDLVVGGAFSAVSGVPTANIARWNGTSWLPLGPGLDARCDALLVLRDGRLLACGNFLFTGGQLTRRPVVWNGTSWSGFGMGMPFAPNANSFLAELPDGQIVVGAQSEFPSAAIIARWNGSAWSSLGTNWVRGLAVAPNGDLLASRDDSWLGPSVDRWNGSAWTRWIETSGYQIRTIAMTSGGNLLLASGLPRVENGHLTVHLHELTTTCPPNVATAGVGCTGAGGHNVLAATTRPWIGAAFRSTATGLAGDTLAVLVNGFGPDNQPLSAVVPQALPGCSLLVTIDVLQLHVASQGRIDAATPIPNSLPLVGLSLHQQVVGLEIVAGTIMAFTSTNALTATLGHF
jgi:trimeric autotransporter adhesin